MNAHTPIHWKLASDNNRCIMDQEGRAVAMVDEDFSCGEGDSAGNEQRGFPREEMLANAAFIVRAVNCHDELLEAVHDLLPYVVAQSYGVERIPDDEGGDPLFQAIDRARAAIDKATG